MARRGRSRGFRRQVNRKFVWDRTQGFAAAPATSGVDLLANFRAQPGATHLGATITRIRGYVYPDPDEAVPVFNRGVVGFRVDSWNEDPLDLDNSPFAQPDEDWMGWLPYFYEIGPTLPTFATWNTEASVFAVDIKSQRKLEELNQTLWMFYSAPATGAITYNWDLSIGLKLP